MLFEHIAALRAKRIVLASTSPRRKEILESLGLAPAVVGSTFDERLDKSQFESPSAYALATAEGKAVEVAARLGSGADGSAPAADAPDLIIAADSVVALDQAILEKPAGREGAAVMMSALSGRDNTVCTGVVLIFPHAAGGARTVRFSEQTKVHFAALSERTIAAYLDLEDYADKAGGYGIQSAAGALIEKIDGCYFNAMGFPKHRFCAVLAANLDAMGL
eukprot:c39007_g1_i1.p1 GENE.c39007_g1_i1~~c39007_g1_i1.p1  ORF type:complete len:220 (+),score=49.63 c39007_g1_i1:97-756(+)